MTKLQESGSIQTSGPGRPVFHIDFNDFRFREDWPENRTVASYGPWRLEVGQEVCVIAEGDGMAATAVVVEVRARLAVVDVDFDSMRYDEDEAA